MTCDVTDLYRAEEAVRASEESYRLLSERSLAGVVRTSLDGRVRGVRGVLPAVLAAARHGVRHVVVPVENVAEAQLVDEVQVHGAATLGDVVRWYGAAEQGVEDEAGQDEGERGGLEHQCALSGVAASRRRIQTTPAATHR